MKIGKSSHHQRNHQQIIDQISHPYDQDRSIHGIIIHRVIGQYQIKRRQQPQCRPHIRNQPQYASNQPQDNRAIKPTDPKNTART